MSREVHVRFWESARVRFPRATQLEVWIYFSSQKFCRIAEIGTFVSLLRTRRHPQDVVVFLTTLSPKFDPPRQGKKPA